MMHAWKKVRELFTFTRNEQRIFLFLSVVFVAGAALKLYRSTTESTRHPEAAFDYRQTDSVFAARSAAGPVMTRSEPAAMPVDLNRAGRAELMRLPGIGDSMASRIIAYRRAHPGGFRTVDELKRVRGIGAKKFEKLRSAVTVKPRAAVRP